MSAIKYAAMARKHWATWLPNKTAELKASGDWMGETVAAGQLAQNQVSELMQQGQQKHEAEETALNQYVLLTPEPPGEDDWEAKELAEMEAEFQAQVRAEQAIDAKYEAEYLKEEMAAQGQPQSRQSTSE